MKIVLMVLMAAATAWSFLAPPAVGFTDPELARIVFFHLPCAYATALFAIYGSVCSAMFLIKRNLLWEYRALAGTELALVFGVATMLTGILFSRIQWLSWWHWDARQTSFLVVLFMLGAYFGLRAAFDEALMRARMAAGYSVLSLLPLLFMVFVFPKLPQVAQKSLHPVGVVVGGRFSPEYWTGILSIFILLCLYGSMLIKQHVRVSQLEEERLNDENLDVNRRDSADDRVVRPVSL
jgi:heme exporter protein C